MILPVFAAALRPDPDDAREWIERELSDPAYAAAEPTLFDRVARAIGDAIARLFSPDIPDALGPAAAVVATIAVVVAIVVGLLVWGRPRRSARATARGDALFAGDDTRSADELRADSRAAADAGRWDDAIVLRFRAIARALAERVVVEAAPGATAQSFVRDAARAFPDAGAALSDAARAFDDVRYLRRPGNADLYRELSELDDRLARTRPIAWAIV